ncbi:MAG: carboxyl transferase domain-containing protein [Pseudomonadota bacterium]
MGILASQLDIHGDAFARQREDMLAALAEVRAVEDMVRATEAAKQDKFHERGQLTPRERINLMLDRGSPFLELSTLAGYRQHDDKDGSLAGGNTIAGIGYVGGVRAMLSASNSAIKGGTMTPWGMRKTLRVQEIALAQKLPLISMIESGGANLLYQAEMFTDGGRIFANQARLSAAGIPQVTVVHGSSTAGGAYMPGLSDYVIMVRKRAKVFLAGPPLLLAATGEVAEDEDLGGAEMHSQVAGTSEFLAENDADAIRIARDVVASLDWNKERAVPAAVRAPLFDPAELCGVVPVDYRKPFDCREVIARIVDGSEFLDFKDEYDIHTVCGRASIHGMVVGIIGNNGPITTHGATKAAQFIQLCDQAGLPLVFLMNTTGFMVGSESEQGGIVKHGSKMIQAVANARVPRITIVIGASFGAGNYGMSGRGFDPDFIFAWPNARTAVMGGEQAGKVLAILARRDGKADPEQVAKMEAGVVAQFERESHCLAGTARLYDDGLIDPRDTRRILAYTLSICREAQARKLHANTFGVARL